MAEARIKQSERAYRRVVQDMLRGRWTAGETVSTYSLADELHMSRTPILEALKRLEVEGLVEIIPQVGCRIVRPAASALEELFAIRGALEGVAAGAAATAIADGRLSELEAALDHLEAVADLGDAARFEDLDHAFHARIVDEAGMPRLAQLVGGVWSLLRQHIAELGIPAAELQASTAEHREIYDGLRRRSSELARMAAERHAERCSARCVAHLEQHPEAGGGHAELVHQALLYGSDEDFLAAAVPFLLHGLDRDERVLAVTTAHNVALLEQALGRRAANVEFRDSADWYRTPSDTLRAYQRYVAAGNGRRVRVLGEPAWTGIPGSAGRHWTRYEAGLNVAFAVTPVSLLCPYDVRALPDSVIDGARETHPEILSGTRVSPSPEFTDFLAPLAAGDSPPRDV